MGTKNEDKAARLLDEYTRMLQKNRKPDEHAFLSRCPECERANLAEAMRSVSFLVSYADGPKISDRALQRTMDLIDETNSRRARLAAAKEFIEHHPLSEITDPLVRLSSALQMPLESMRKALLQRQPIAQAATYYRSATSASANARRQIDGMSKKLERVRSQQAEDLLERVGITGLPVDLPRVCDYLHLLVEEAPLDEGLEGCLVSYGDIGGILVNSLVEYYPRRRFTLAHEIGHFVLHRHFKVWRDSSETMNDPFAQDVEREAHAFASGLLMPTTLIPWDCIRDKPCLEHVDAISKQCTVSFAAAAIRLVLLSDWPCALVCVQDGKVKWSRQSEEFHHFIRSGKSVHRSSVAHVLGAKPDIEREGWHLSASAWFDDDRFDDGLEVWEESWAAGGGFVYSLLILEE